MYQTQKYTIMKINNLIRKESERTLQAWIPTKSGKLIMSIVCGESLYCTPRQSNLKAEEYSEFEVAIFDGETGDWASYNQVKPVFDLLGKGEYYEKDWDNNPKDLDKPQNAVFGYIPREAIEKAWKLL